MSYHGMTLGRMLGMLEILSCPLVVRAIGHDSFFQVLNLQYRSVLGTH